ncbi:hypothetical protein CKZ66_20580 [Salmonella enterica subsp. enterica serovar Montevideo]|nr:hypothetical protein [Salmonella enterica subsp. enterica serovar Montevideo]
MCRNAQTVGYFGNGITAFCYLTDGFFLKFRCKSWCAHTLLLCSNYRAGSSTGAGSVQTIGQDRLPGRGQSNYRAGSSTGAGSVHWLIAIVRKKISD